jgi:uncharacterized protein (TIGR03437 family)
MLLLLVALLGAALPLRGQSTTFKVTPATLAFAHQVGDTKLPTAQTVSVAGTVGFAAALSAGPWLTVTPTSGTAPSTLRANVNPSTLPVGTYAGTITVITAEQAPQTAVVAVTLVVRAAPSTLTPSATAPVVAYVRGAPPPEPVSVSLTTSGAVLSFTTATAGGAWLSASPKSGVVFPAFPGTLSLVANPVGLVPGSYKGTVTVSAPQASNKTITLNVTLNVSAGAPSVSTVWPSQIPQGSAATTVTLQGDNFFAGSVVKASAATLSSTYLGPNVMSAVIPASLLGAPSTLPILVSNPGQGGGDSPPAPVTVVPPGPIISAVVNAASLTADGLAPGAMVTVFGSGLGPDKLTTFTPAGGLVPTVLLNSRILFGSAPAPIIYASATQVSAMVPHAVAALDQVEIRAEYNGVRSLGVALPVVRSAPGIFTANSAGTGLAAAFAFDEDSGTYLLLSESTSAKRGSLVVFYATGEGGTDTPGVDGLLVTQPAAAPNPGLSIKIGGAEAPVLYAGGVVGLVSGIVQVNTRVPESIAVGKAVPVLLTINGAPSQAGVTIPVK